MSLIVSAAGPSTTWYLTRSTGAVCLLLLTASVALGVIDVQRVSSPRWPRFALDALHRNVSLLAVCFLVAHVLTSVLDSFTSIGLLDAVIPFTGSYRPFWLGLGAVALDLLLAVVITSLLRQRFGHRAWRTTHWLAYASWPIALLHSFGTGSDTKSGWMLTLELVCLLVVLGALLVRIIGAWPEHSGQGRLALGGAAGFLLLLAVWVPTGPLGSEWARRSGTPQALLPHAKASSGSQGKQR